MNKKYLNHITSNKSYDFIILDLNIFLVTKIIQTISVNIPAQINHPFIHTRLINNPNHIDHTMSPNLPTNWLIPVIAQPSFGCT